VSSTSIDTSAELAALLTNETGTGRAVFSISPAFSGTATFSGLTATGTASFATTTQSKRLTLSGSVANIALGSNYLSGDGGDEGIFVSSTGNVGIGTTTSKWSLHVASTTPYIALSSHAGDIDSKHWLLTHSGTGIFQLLKANDSLALSSYSQMIIDSSTGSFYVGEHTNTSTGIDNIGIGTRALLDNTNGTANIAMGSSALISNISGDGNTAIGSGGTLSNNVNGDQNIAIGYSTLGSITNNSYNIAMGSGAFSSLSSGNYNVGIGFLSGATLTAGTSTTFLGTFADASSASLSTSTAIGAGALVGCSNCMALGGIGPNAVNVGIGTSTPSRALTVAGSARLTGALYDTNNSAGTLGMVLQSTATGQRWVATSTLGLGGSGGSVSSVALAAPTGFSVSGSPVTSSGTLTLSFSAGYEGLRTASSTNWNNFYNTPSNRITAGTGLSWSTNTLNCATASGSTQGCLTSANWTLFNNKVSSTSIDTSAELAALLTNETGSGALVFGTAPTLASTTISGILKLSSQTASRALFTDAQSRATTTALSATLLNSLTDETGTGRLVFSSSPAFSGTATFSSLTATGTATFATTTQSGRLTLSGSAANIALGSNYLSGDGGDEGIFVSSTGNVGIGSTSPQSLLTIDKTSGLTGSIVAGIKERFTFNNGTASAVYYGDNAYIVNAPTATSTLVGKMLRIEDSSNLGNVVRGLEVQAHRGTNTKGENTGISGFGRTFGVRGTTEGDAGALFEPAGLYGETRGTTQSNAIRGYSGTLTTSELFSLYQDTSAFAGTGLLMNFGNGTGSFSSSTSKFIDLQVAGVSKFGVLSTGATGIGTSTPSSKLAVLGTAGSTQDIFSVASSTNAKLFNVKSSGLVGIGSTTPSRLFTVSGTSYLGATTTIAGRFLPVTNDLYDLGSTGNRFRDLYLGGETIHLGTSLTDEATFGYNTTSNILNIGTDSTTNGDIAFFTDDLYLDNSTGYVGIGTTTPSKILTVASASSTSALRIHGSTPGTQIADIFVGGTGQLVLSTRGGAGVAQFIDLAPEDDLYGLILRDPGTTGTSYTNFYQNDSTVDYLNIVQNTGNATKGLLVYDGEYVGIGTTTALVALGSGDFFTGAANTGLFEIDANTSYTYQQFSNENNAGAANVMRKSRGSISAPVAVSSLDDIGLYRGFAYAANGTWVESARMTFDTEGTITGAIVPGVVRFHTQNSAGTLTTALTISSTQDAAFTGNVSMALDTTGTTNNAVCWDNAGVSNMFDCDATPADYAESYPTQPSVSFGDIVMTTPEIVTTQIGTKVAKLAKAIKNEGAVIGITSDNYHDFTSAGKEEVSASHHPLPVALVGRVPVKVNLEGGAIAIGDSVTLSSVAGVGAKATTSGAFVVGRALESFDADDVADGKTTVLVFVENGTFETVGDRLRAELFAQVVTGTLTSDLFEDYLAMEGDTLWTRLARLAHGFVDGVLTVAGLRTDELCIGDTCVNEAQLIELLNDSGSTPPPTPPPSGGDGSGGDSPTGGDTGGSGTGTGDGGSTGGTGGSTGGDTGTGDTGTGGSTSGGGGETPPSDPPPTEPPPTEGGG
jgi:hypothetical protein